MKRFLFSSMIFLATCAQAQNAGDSSGMKYFDRGMDFYNKLQHDSAIAVWQGMVSQGIGKGYDTYGSAFFNIPNVYWEIGKIGKAKEWFNKILASDLRDSDETGNLMEPHKNYKHKSAMGLASLAQQEKNPAEELRWLYLADTVYRYWGFEGSATNVSQSQAYLLQRKVNTLLELKRKPEAIQATIIELICAGRLENFFSESERKLFTLIDITTFQTEFDAALENLTITSVNDTEWVARFNFQGLAYNFRIGNVYPNRNLPHYWTIYFIAKDTSPDKQKVIDYIKSRRFYKKLARVK